MNYYTTGYGQPTSLISSLDSAASAGIWIIIAFVLAIIGAFLVYFLFVRVEKKYDGKFLNWLREFLNFQAMLIEPIAKISYIFLALFITLSSFAYISVSFVGFLLTLVLGNLTARVIYELLMITISIWKNTKEINKKMK